MSGTHTRKPMAVGGREGPKAHSVAVGLPGGTAAAAAFTVPYLPSRPNRGRELR